MLINRKRISNLFVLLISIFFMTGCKTAVSHGFGANRVYSGTRFTFEMYETDEQGVNPNIKENILALTIFNIVDFPLCICADTLILPITLPCSTFGDNGEFNKMLREKEPDACVKHKKD